MTSCGVSWLCSSKQSLEGLWAALAAKGIERAPVWSRICEVVLRSLFCVVERMGCHPVRVTADTVPPTNPTSQSRAEPPTHAHDTRTRRHSPLWLA